MSIDYGQKRVGLAVTDEQRMIATALGTVPSKDVISYLEEYLKLEKVDIFVVGLPKNLKNELSDSSRFTEPFVNLLKRKFPAIPVERIDERFTSKMASAAILQSGVNRKTRQDKAIIDKVSAVIMLQDYLSML